MQSMSRIKFLDALPGTISEIMDRAKISDSMARKLALQCHAAGEIHISGYMTRVGTPSQIYSRGPGDDVQQPKPRKSRSRRAVMGLPPIDTRVAQAISRNRAVFPLAAVWSGS